MKNDVVTVGKDDPLRDLNLTPEQRASLDSIKKQIKKDQPTLDLQKDFILQREKRLRNERRVNLWDVAKLPHAPKTLLTALQSVQDGSEYWIHEFGNQYCDLLPSFWRYHPNGEKTEYKINISRKQYSGVGFLGKSFDCHRLAACAFLENTEPHKLNHVDHRTNPRDELLVQQTQVIWIRMKQAFGGKMHSLQPHFCNFTAYGLQWLSSGQNIAASREESHREFKDKVKDYSLEESLKDIAKLENAHSRLEEIILYANSIGYEINEEDLKDKPVSSSLTLGYANIKKVEEQRLINAEEIAERAKESLRCAELGEKTYVKTVLEEHKENHTLFKTSSFEYSLVGVFENAFNSKIHNWTETDWDDVYSYVVGCVWDQWHPLLGSKPTLERYKNPRFADWAIKEVEKCRDSRFWWEFSISIEVADVFKAIQFSDEEKLSSLETQEKRVYNI